MTVIGRAWRFGAFLRGALASAILAAATALPGGAVLAQSGDDSTGKSAESVEKDQFTPPMFGAPQKRIGAGSRKLAEPKLAEPVREPCPTDASANADSPADADGPADADCLAATDQPQ